MFGGDAVGLAHHLVLVLAHDDLAEIRPCLAGGVGGRQDLQDPLHLGHGVARELLGVGEQDRRRGRAVLGLAEQVGGADFAVDAVVGDDQRLGRAGEQIDADPAIQLALCLRHVGVAGTDDHVDAGNRLGAERHGGDRLHAAEHEDLVGAAEMHRRDDRRMRAAAERRRARDDAFDPRDLGGDDRHVRRGDHRVAPARHVAADRIHRDVAMAEDDAGQRLDLEIAHRFFLLLGEVAHLRLGELDVVEIALGDLADRALDLLRGELEARRRPVVELFGQVAHGGFAAGFNVGENFFDRLAHLGVRRLDGARVHSALEGASHGDLLVLGRHCRAASASADAMTRQSIVFVYSNKKDGPAGQARG